MPTIGKKQKAAGVKLNFAKDKPGTRKMESRDKNIKSSLRIDDVPYNGRNAVLNAMKS
jgi:hypothetical protein